MSKNRVPGEFVHSLIEALFGGPEPGISMGTSVGAVQNKPIIEVMMIGGGNPFHEHFLRPERKFLRPERKFLRPERKAGARADVRRRLDAGFSLSREEYSAAMDELIDEMKAEQEEVVAGIRQENSELRAQVEGLKGALVKARDTLAEQDRVIGSLVRGSGRTSALS